MPKRNLKVFGKGEDECCQMPIVNKEIQIEFAVCKNKVDKYDWKEPSAAFSSCNALLGIRIIHGIKTPDN